MLNEGKGSLIIIISTAQSMGQAGLGVWEKKYTFKTSAN